MGQYETRERLSREDMGFQRLERRHQEYSARLEELQALKHPTEAEQEEEIRLKKMKLALKDQMEEMVSRAAT